jgi:hypothetical protein
LSYRVARNLSSCKWWNSNDIQTTCTFSASTRFYKYISSISKLEEDQSILKSFRHMLEVIRTWRVKSNNSQVNSTGCLFISAACAVDCIWTKKYAMVARYWPIRERRFTFVIPDSYARIPPALLTSGFPSFSYL